MNEGQPSCLYLRLRKRVGIRPGEHVTLGRAARLFSSDSALEKQMESLVLHRHRQQDGNRVVIDLLQIVKMIRDAVPGTVVDSYGDPQVLVIVADEPRKPRLWVLMLAWLLLFFGAGLAIMNFHTDVNMKDVHTRITELVTGRKIEHPLWFQVPYSIGIGAGMLVFFNHLFRKRFNEEPNPLEVELYMYEENVNAYVIADEMRKKSEPNEPQSPKHSKQEQETGIDDG
ncbi:stage V sporulation protein AA [Paenibacillus albus]|uniref:Stage V sporulation protein AA n=1 Tax=Paenibacillus albus TaxID=2495582 RepID=A0A3S9A4K3_9BACL|nr:stage V sporulation protein AA [Paenibacillus albus]AZN40667.1 stage V sporulation protein AA [Paenibacillus albus]